MLAILSDFCLSWMLLLRTVDDQTLHAYVGMPPERDQVAPVAHRLFGEQGVDQAVRRLDVVYAHALVEYNDSEGATEVRRDPLDFTPSAASSTPQKKRKAKESFTNNKIWLLYGDRPKPS